MTAEELAEMLERAASNGKDITREDLKDMLNDLKEKIDKKTEDEINYYLNMSGNKFNFIYLS